MTKNHNIDGLIENKISLIESYKRHKKLETTWILISGLVFLIVGLITLAININWPNNTTIHIWTACMNVVVWILFSPIIYRAVKWSKQYDLKIKRLTIDINDLMVKKYE